MMDVAHFGDQIEIHGMIRDRDQIAAYDYIVSTIAQDNDEATDIIGYALLEAAETLQAVIEGKI